MSNWWWLVPVWVAAMVVVCAFMHGASAEKAEPSWPRSWREYASGRDEQVVVVDGEQKLIGEWLLAEKDWQWLSRLRQCERDLTMILQTTGEIVARVKL